MNGPCLDRTSFNSFLPTALLLSPVCITNVRLVEIYTTVWLCDSCRSSSFFFELNRSSSYFCSSWHWWYDQANDFKKKKIRLLIGPLCLFVVVNYTELVHGRSMSKPADSSHLISGKNPGVKRSGCFRASFKKKRSACLLVRSDACILLGFATLQHLCIQTHSQKAMQASHLRVCMWLHARSGSCVAPWESSRDGAYDSLIPSASNTYGLPCG